MIFCRHSRFGGSFWVMNMKGVGNKNTLVHHKHVKGMEVSFYFGAGPLSKVCVSSVKKTPSTIRYTKIFIVQVPSLLKVSLHFSSCSMTVTSYIHDSFHTCSFQDNYFRSNAATVFLYLFWHSLYLSLNYA